MRLRLKRSINNLIYYLELPLPRCYRTLSPPFGHRFSPSRHPLTYLYPEFLNTLYFVNKITALTMYYLPLLIRLINHSLKPSQLPGEYTAQLLPFRRMRATSTHNNQSAYPHRHPFILLGEEKQSTVKCLAQGARSQPRFEPIFGDVLSHQNTNPMH